MELRYLIFFQKLTDDDIGAEVSRFFYRTYPNWIKRKIENGDYEEDEDYNFYIKKAIEEEAKNAATK